VTGKFQRDLKEFQVYHMTILSEVSVATMAMQINICRPRMQQLVAQVQTAKS
jgi:hypothetical protein